jgi:diguanylate cyclase (GGDEF)-like protein
VPSPYPWNAPVCSLRTTHPVSARAAALVVLLLLAFAPAAAAGGPEPVALGGDWAFRTGDDPAWALPATDDAGWRRIAVPGDWEAAIGAYDGFAWYRTQLRLSADLGSAPVGVRFGSVGDAYEVFWNGVLLGGRGRMPPRFVDGVPPGVFLVPDSALARSEDGGHLVAVRVYNHYAYGGLMGEVRVGAYEVLARARSPRSVVVSGLVSFFLAIGVYHLAFWLRRRSALENLHFAALCGCVSVYGATYASPVQEALMPYVNPYRLGLMVLLAGAPAYLALVNRLFGMRGGARTRLVMLLFAVAVGVAMSLPLRLLAEFNRVIDFLLMAGLVVVMVRAWRARQSVPAHGGLLVAGTVSFSGALGYDLASEYGLVPVAQILPGLPSLFWIGFLVFVVAVGIATAGEWARTESAALVDPLTGLSRRHVLDEALRRESERLRRTGGSVALVMIDLDHFKRINDTHGHPVGDAVLARVGRLLRASTRNLDLPARFGGEEFAVLLYDVGLDGALTFADRFRAHLGELRVAVDGGPSVEVTASMGIAVGGELVDPAVLLRTADRALYRAKAAGRDRLISVVLDAGAREGVFVERTG